LTDITFVKMESSGHKQSTTQSTFVAIIEFSTT